MKTRYVYKTFFNLEEVCKKEYPSLTPNPYINSFKNIFYTQFSNAPLWNELNGPKQYIDEVWNLVRARYRDHYAESSESDEITSTFECLLRIVNVFVMTYDKYSTILTAFKTQETHLLDQIKATSDAVVGYNDTPQNGGEFIDDEHRSNITETHSENGVDGDTPIARLDEIKRKMSSILYEWSNEFDKLFIEEGNI